MTPPLRDRVAVPAALVILALSEAIPDSEIPRHIARALGGAASDDRETAVLGALGYFTQVSFLDRWDDPVVEYCQARLKDIGVLVFEELKISNDDLDVLDETIREKSGHDLDELKSVLKWLSRFRELCRDLRFKEAGG